MNIVIVGGGTAGWIAALMISRIHNNKHRVIVVESSKIGIVGAGEGSTGLLTDLINGQLGDFGCVQKDFMLECDATVKLGIKHKDWKNVGHTYYGPIDFAPQDIMMNNILYDNPVHKSSICGYLMDNNKTDFYVTEDHDLRSHNYHAFHFDAHKVGKYFRKVCGDSVKTIDAEVVDIQLDEQGNVDHIVLDRGEKIKADFFIDCTGFNRIFAEKMGVKWHSYAKNLPVNTAMPFFLDYDVGENIEPVTTAWAQSSGWMWDIPILERRGCGYVFDDNFISHEEAHREIESKLGKKIEPIKFLKFETGRGEVLWKKNVLFLGLAAAFAEPLEATSIHSTIIQIQGFVLNFLKATREQTCNPGSISMYNNRMTKMYDDFKDFLVLHYMTNRDDTPFWKWINTGETASERVKEVIEMSKVRLLMRNDFLDYYGSAGYTLFNWILCGLGYMTKETAKEELTYMNSREYAKFNWEEAEQKHKEIENSCIDNTTFVVWCREFLVKK